MGNRIKTFNKISITSACAPESNSIVYSSRKHSRISIQQHTDQ